MRKALARTRQALLLRLLRLLNAWQWSLSRWGHWAERRLGPTLSVTQFGMSDDAPLGWEHAPEHWLATVRARAPWLIRPPRRGSVAAVHMPDSGLQQPGEMEQPEVAAQSDEEKTAQPWATAGRDRHYPPGRSYRVTAAVGTTHWPESEVGKDLVDPSVKPLVSVKSGGSLDNRKDPCISQRRDADSVGSPGVHGRDTRFAGTSAKERARSRPVAAHGNVAHATAAEQPGFATFALSGEERGTGYGTTGRLVPNQPMRSHNYQAVPTRLPAEAREWHGGSGGMPSRSSIAQEMFPDARNTREFDGANDAPHGVATSPRPTLPEVMLPRFDEQRDPWPRLSEEEDDWNDARGWPELPVPHRTSDRTATAKRSAVGEERLRREQEGRPWSA